jgi:uncharacterized protein YpmB
MDNNNMQNSSGMMNGMPPMPKPERKVGPIVGVLIIVLVLIIAALYFFAQRLNTTAPLQDNTTATTQTEQTTDQSATAAPAVQGSDDVTSINADLNGTLKDVDYSF